MGRRRRGRGGGGRRGWRWGRCSGACRSRRAGWGRSERWRWRRLLQDYWQKVKIRPEFDSIGHYPSGIDRLACVSRQLHLSVVSRQMPGTQQNSSICVGLLIDRAGLPPISCQNLVRAYPKNAADASLCVGISGIGMPLVRFFG